MRAWREEGLSVDQGMTRGTEARMIAAIECWLTHWIAKPEVVVMDDESITRPGTVLRDFVKVERPVEAIKIALVTAQSYLRPMSNRIKIAMYEVLPGVVRSFAGIISKLSRFQIVPGSTK